MARKKAVTYGKKGRRGRPPTRSANVAESPQPTGPEMSPPSSDKKASPAKRTPRKAAARGKWSEENLLTSDKSVLIHEDLVKLLSKPEAWNVLEEDEKREILALLPADIHPDADLSTTDPERQIPPLPQQFIRYSTNWREGLRVFQLDLENGRYDPEWLRQAENARRERENGDFDSFKEREFEEFWGQKQKMNMAAAAGEHGRIHLKALVEAGVIQPGDIWRFNFVFGRGESRLVVDKEARVHEINGTLLSFVVATGPRTILTSVHGEGPEATAYDSIEPDLCSDTKLEEVKKGLLEAATAAESAELTLQAMPSNADENTAQSTVKETGQNGEVISKDLNHILNETPAATITPNGNAKMKENGEEIPQKLNIAPHKSSLAKSKSSVQVLIVSPRKNANSAGKTGKRTVPSPAPEPPVKRKRGRPRKNPMQPEPETEQAPEAESQPGNLSPSEPAASQLTEFERAKPDVIVPTSKEVSTPTKPINDSMPASSKVVPNKADSLNTKKATTQDNPSDSPLSEAPKDPLATQAEQEPQSASKPKPLLPVTPYGPNEVIITGVKTPANLVNYLLQIDGRPKEGARTANAWKEIRCYRKNQDMGSLFDVRQAWYFKQKRNEKTQEQGQESDSDWEG